MNRDGNHRDHSARCTADSLLGRPLDVLRGDEDLRRKQIGAGAIGVVYAAYDDQLDRKVREGRRI